jgi:hypothetical protein
MPTYSPSHPAKYYKAQLAFRGYSPLIDDIETLKSRLRFAVADKGEEMDKDVRDRARQMKWEFERKQRVMQERKQKAEGEKKRRLEQKWENRVVDEELAKEHPRGFLKALFCDEGINEGVPPVVLKMLGDEERWKMHNAAHELGLESESAWDGSARRRKRVMVVGQKVDVEEMITETDERNGRGRGRGRKDTMPLFSTDAFAF